MDSYATPEEIGILSAFVERIAHRSASVKDIRELPYLIHESIRILSRPTNAALAHNVGFDRFLKHGEPRSADDSIARGTNGAFLAYGPPLTADAP